LAVLWKSTQLYSNLKISVNPYTIPTVCWRDTAGTGTIRIPLTGRQLEVAAAKESNSDKPGFAEFPSAGGVITAGRVQPGLLPPESV